MAHFLKTFGGYTLKDLMEENALTVFALVNEAAKLRAVDRLDEIMVHAVPNMEERDAREMMQSLEYQANGGVIDLDEEADTNMVSELKSIFGG